MRRVLDISGLEIDRCLQAERRGGAGSVGRHWVDMVLTDINMPVMDGEELLQGCPGSDIPVDSGRGVSTDRTECRIRNMLSLGAKGYVTKPFSPETLRQSWKSLGVFMEPLEVQAAIAGAVEEVLETMCFTSSSPVPSGVSAEASPEGELRFDRPGCALRVTPRANFTWQSR